MTEKNASPNPFTGQRLRVGHLNPARPTEFAIAPDDAGRAAIAAELDLLDLPELHFEGRVEAAAGEAWELTGRLHARVVQPCVVTLEPVETVIDEKVRRLYSPHATDPEAEEAEMPDDEVEPLGRFIDPGAVMAETLSLALPPWPRAPGAETAEPVRDPIAETPSEDVQRPFAGLADLLAQKRDGTES